jgi:serine protease Do
MKLSQATAALTAAGILVTSAAGAAGWSPREWFARQDSAPPAAATAVAPAASPVAPATAPNYRAIVERFGPAVVGINTEGTIKTAARSDNDDDPFSQFFRGLPGRGGQPPVPVHGQGSGFIVGQDGIILTNAHVVKGASEVTVKLSDRREFKARVLGSDPATDIAVLKIDASKLPVVTLGDPRRLAVGDYVLAIGSPFGFEQSATSGIVSAKGRSLPGDAYVPFIQTDVAVNPGNSGGPLFDASGAVVGINSQIYSQTGGYMGLSFAIPIDVALSVKDQIVATGRVSHARLGVAVQELNQTLADSFRLPKPEGALVSSIDRNSPAARAGLQAGDVILSYNGQAD